MRHSNTVDIEGVGPVLFERSKRARRLVISINPFTGVRVAVPEGLSFQKAEEFAKARTDWIRKHQRTMRQYETENSVVPDPFTDAERARAKSRLVRRLRHLASKYGFTFNRVFIRSQKTRWGSCSSRNNISLNTRLVRLPEDLVNYVILHELTHTRVRNHSSAFWVELNRFVSNGKGMASRLKKYGVGIL